MEISENEREQYQRRSKRQRQGSSTIQFGENVDSSSVVVPSTAPIADSEPTVGPPSSPWLMSEDEDDTAATVTADNS